jgi:hypothetical protein
VQASGEKMDSKSRYRSYLLRIWREGFDGERRASLQDVASGEMINFANLADMFAYLCLHVQETPAQRPRIEEITDIPAQ